MSDWSIAKRTGECSECGGAFAEGAPHFSMLFAEEGLLARRDACEACFESREEQDELVFWRTRKPLEKGGGLKLDLESIDALFEALGGREEERLLQLRYLLSLLLVRKRRLKVVQVGRRPEGEVLILRRPRREDTQDVRVFELTEERQLELREELKKLFEGGELEEVLALVANPQRPVAEGETPETPEMPEANARAADAIGGDPRAGEEAGEGGGDGPAAEAGAEAAAEAASAPAKDPSESATEPAK